MRPSAAIVLAAILPGAPAIAAPATNACPGAATATAALALGVRNDIGDGTQADPSAAFRCYLSAAQAGLPAAQFNVAVMLDSGRGAAPDASQAALWYGRAAAAGHARARYDLALLYEAGTGVPKNLAMARQWYLAAAQAGIQAATVRAAALPLQADAPAAAIPLATTSASQPQPGQTDTGAVRETFVWTAPPQPLPTRFVLSVATVADGTVREVASTSTSLSAATLDLPPVAAAYAWRIYSVSDQTGHYAATDWKIFTVAPP